MKKIRKGLPQSMKIKQYEITISPKKRGFHLITNEIIDQIGDISNASVGFSLFSFILIIVIALSLKISCRLRNIESYRQTVNIQI